jgi:flagellar hook-associated protein 2
MSDPISTFSGLASGIDFRTLVDQIIAVESAPIRRIDRQIVDIGARSSAWGEFRGLVEDFESAAQRLRDGNVFGSRLTTVRGPTDPPAFTASTRLGADVGSREVRVLSLASAERMAGSDFASRSEALGLSGSFVVNGRTISVAADDALEDVARKIDDAFVSSTSGTVEASVLQIASDQFRLVLTSGETGAEGLDLVDPDGLLRDLGLLDDTVSLKNATTAGARSDRYISRSLDIGDQLGLAAAPAGTVTVGGVAVSVDLSTMALDDVADAINTAAAGAGSSISATVVEETIDGEVAFRLDVSGTTAFVDDGRVLETLGVLQGGREGVAQRLRSANALQQGDGTTPATTSTLLTDLSVEGAASGVSAGDTLTISGTRGDGTTFSTTLTVGASDTMQTLLDRLNDGADGFGAGDRTAVASLDADGSILVDDQTAGGSRLALSIVANNEGGGTLDLGSFGVEVAGRDRVVTEGANAQLEVDGVFLERSTNTVGDVVDGVTLELRNAKPDEVVSLEVERDPGAVVGAVQELVDAYNAVSSFSRDQSPDENGAGAGPLSGDATMRTMVSTLRRTMQERLGADVAGGLSRLGEVGIEIQSDGTFSFDAGTFQETYLARPGAIQRLLGDSGSGSVSSLDFVSSTSATEPGTYAVEITQPATQATVLGVGFGGTYVDDGTADTLTIRDLGEDSSYSIELTDGMTMAEIVAALQTELATPQAVRITGQNALQADGVGTPASSATVFADLFIGGASAGVANGDTFAIAGRGSDGGTIFREFTVTDAATQTLGDLTAEVQAELGDEFTVFIDENGVFTAEAKATGTSLVELSLTSDNLGGGSFDLGAVEATREGRTAARIGVSEVGGQLSIEALDFGSSNGFEISFTAGGADGSASLGVTADTYTGLDVAGTIGGFAATGRGRLLTGDEGSAVEGLVARYTGATAGPIGDLSFNRGIASLLERVAEPLIGAEQGSIQSLIDQGDSRIQGLNDRIAFLEDRLERRRASLIDRFVGLEEALARGQQQISFLLSQLGQSGGGAPS